MKLRLDLLKQMTVEDVLEEYPTLTREDVLACLQFSSRLMGNHFTLLQVA